MENIVAINPVQWKSYKNWLKISIPINMSAGNWEISRSTLKVIASTPVKETWDYFFHKVCKTDYSK